MAGADPAVGVAPDDYGRAEGQPGADLGGSVDVVYRLGVGSNGCDSVVFAERTRAERVASIIDALQNSTTWGEFRSALPEGEWAAHFKEYFGDAEEDPPTNDDAFEADDVVGYADGDYPEWLGQVQLEWFPKELIDKYGGEITQSVLNGSALDLPADKAEQIAEDLRALGHTVECSDLNFELS